MRVLDNNGSINKNEEIAVEKNVKDPEEQTNPSDRLLKLLMSAGVTAALAIFIYALFYFMNNSGV